MMTNHDFDELADLDDLTRDAAPSPVDMVVFDIGNVLVRWEPMLAIAPVVGEDVARAFLTDDVARFAAYNLEADAGRAWPDIIEAIGRETPHYRAAAQAYFDNFLDAVAEPIAGSIAILEELKAADIPLYALTNFNDVTFSRTREHHTFLELFDDIIVSGEEGVIKPDEEIWEILEEVTRHVGGLSDAIFIDDSPINVMGAEQAGLDGILFTDPESLREDLRLRGLPLAKSANRDN